MPRPSDLLGRLLTRIAPLGILFGCACSEPCTRIAISGLVAPLPAALPAPGISLQELPPLGRDGGCADGPHGGTLMAIDARQFLCDHGELLPDWSPPPAPAAPRDGNAWTHHLQSLTALMQALLVADAHGTLPAGRVVALSATLETLAQRLGAVLGGLALVDAGGRTVNARDAVVLQVQARARLQEPPVRSGVDTDASPPLFVYDAARDLP